MAGSAIDGLSALLEAQEGRVTAADVPLGIAALTEYLESGAALGRGLRKVRAAMKPLDPAGIQLGYLFNLIIDAANHEGRLGPIEAYAASEYPLAAEAAGLLAIMQSEVFRAQVGWRPTTPGEKRHG